MDIEEGYMLSDVLCFQYNINTDNTSVYDVVNFRKKMSAFVTVCKGFSRPRRVCKSAEIVKNNIRELIEKNPSISINEIILITRYGRSIIDRYYMPFKKVYRSRGRNMKSKEECRLYSESKCIAADLENCDFEGEDHEKCLRYRVYHLRPQTMQLR